MLKINKAIEGIIIIKCFILVYSLAWIKLKRLDCTFQSFSQTISLLKDAVLSVGKQINKGTWAINADLLLLLLLLLFFDRKIPKVMQ